MASDLIPAELAAAYGREPPPRLILENGDQHRQLPHLRDLVSEIRRILGERGLTITRFKEPDSAKWTRERVVGDDAGPGEAGP